MSVHRAATPLQQSLTEIALGRLACIFVRPGREAKSCRAVQAVHRHCSELISGLSSLDSIRDRDAVYQSTLICLYPVVTMRLASSPALMWNARAVVDGAEEDGQKQLQSFASTPVGLCKMREAQHRSGVCILHRICCAAARS